MTSETKRPLHSSPADGLSGTLRVPGDKSISHRALMFGALAVGEHADHRPAGRRGRAAHRRRHAGARRRGRATAPAALARLPGRGVGGLVEPADVLDMGNSGTAARLLLGLLAGHPLFAVMTGDASLRAPADEARDRPASASGARFCTREGGRLPLAVRGAAEPLPLRLPPAGRLGAGEDRRSCWPA